VSPHVFALAIRAGRILETRFSSGESEREPYGSEKFFAIKRFGQEGRSPCVQGCRRNQRIVLSVKMMTRVEGEILPSRD